MESTEGEMPIINIISIPVVCDCCKARVLGIFVPDSPESIIFPNHPKAVRTKCPNCNNWIYLNEPTFKGFQEILSFIKIKNPSKVALRKLEEILRTGKQSGENAEAIAAVIAKEIPELAPVGNFLIKSFKEKPEAWATFLLTLMAFIWGIMKDERSSEVSSKPIAQVVAKLGGKKLVSSQKKPLNKNRKRRRY